ncbi:MAG: CBS domain-containing protein [Desulfobacula sp.]|jgi:CBS domain-containing protein
MKEKKVKEVMIALSDYATVSEDDTLATAIKTLKKARDDKKYVHKHRSVLVYDKKKNIVGKVSIRCVLQSLEPKYCQLEHQDAKGSLGASRFGFSEHFLNSLIENFCLWDETLEELVKHATKQKIKDIMYTPSNGEFVDEDASLAAAVHQFILGTHQSLLVTKKKKVTGILRLVDLFDLVSEALGD